MEKFVNAFEQSSSTEDRLATVRKCSLFLKEEMIFLPCDKRFVDFAAVQTWMTAILRWVRENRDKDASTTDLFCDNGSVTGYNLAPLVCVVENIQCFVQLCDELHFAHILSRAFEAIGEGYTECITCITAPGFTNDVMIMVGDLFKLCSQLMTIAFDFLDKHFKTAIPDFSSEHQAQAFLSLCGHMTALLPQVRKLDPNMFDDCVQHVVSIYERGAEAGLKDCLDLTDALGHIGEAIRDILTKLNAVENATDLIGEERRRSLTSFFSLLKLLIHVVHAFKFYVGDGVTPVIHLILDVYHLFVRARSVDLHAIWHQLWSYAALLVSAIAEEPNFLESVLNLPNSGKQHFERMLLQVGVLKELCLTSKSPEITTVNTGMRLVQHILASLPQFESWLLATEKVVPGVVKSGQAQIYVTLYEHILIHVNGFLARLDEIRFVSMERFLWTQWFDADSDICRLFFEDCLCFLARMGPSKLCYDWCSLLVTGIVRASDLPYTDVPILARRKCLLARLAGCLGPNQRAQLANLANSCKAGHVIWQVYPVHCMTADLATALVFQLENTSVDSLPLTTVINMLACGRLLLKWFWDQGKEKASSNGDPGLVNTVSRFATQLLHKLRGREFEKMTDKFEHVVGSLLYVCTELIIARQLTVQLVMDMLSFMDDNEPTFRSRKGVAYFAGKALESASGMKLEAGERKKLERLQHLYKV